ncbi:hypothetical protein [Halalkalibacter okhensis]|uniref:DUF3221 domain-containing protein n=1 Tax=Halalkalibacter okhensis TaxID=333138 RepID=A0A0B0ICB4_9BACI|nr:hypothetical protein [Halalkalibacter okhensis]KHF38905.1 hypothetical protein LQ50_18410 [Halalkalibacter okhensis]
MHIIKNVLVIVTLLTVTLLGACGINEEKNKEIGEVEFNSVGGIMLAGEELPEVVGVIKSIESLEEVIIYVDGQEVSYRLSDEAKSQITAKELESGDEVIFTTYSIGDDKATIDTFIKK